MLDKRIRVLYIFIISSTLIFTILYLVQYNNLADDESTDGEPTSEYPPLNNELLPPNSFVTVWRIDHCYPGDWGGTCSDDFHIKLPLESNGIYDFHVDWGDGTSDRITRWDQSEVYHEYQMIGYYLVIITGTLEGWSFGVSQSYAYRLREIRQWGCLKLGNSGGYFDECGLTMISALDKLDLSGITTFRSMFRWCCGLRDVKGIQDWNVSEITDMTGMFLGNFFFNPNISTWNTSKVTSMNFMFYDCEDFNQNISDWDVSKVTKMSGMFSNARSFNQNIENWDVSRVTDMSLMFCGATSFNQNIGNWKVSKVTKMGGMFSSARAFNQNIGNWDVSRVTDMSLMFYEASSFNQDIGKWNVTNVTNMRSIFEDAQSFDQNIGNWNVTNVTNMDSMFRHITLSTTNYDNILIGWASLPLQHGISFDGGNSKFDAGSVAREYLIDTLGWTIIDGGKMFYY